MFKILNETMEKNSDVSVVENLWLEVKKSNIIAAKKKELAKEYHKLYPHYKAEDIKLGNTIVDSHLVEISYIEYSEEKEVPVLDADGNPVVDPETGNVKTKLEPVIPDEYYTVTEPNKEDEEGQKVLKPNFANAPLRPTLDYFVEKKTKEWLQNPENLKIDMDQFVPFIKPYMVKLVNVEFSKAMNAITNKYPEHEQMTWDQQEQEARAYKADPKNAKTPLISNIAKARGIDLDTLADKIIAKAEAYKQAAGLAIGYRQEAEGVISTIATYEDYQKVVAGLEAKRDLFYKVVEGK